MQQLQFSFLLLYDPRTGAIQNATFEACEGCNSDIARIIEYDSYLSTCNGQ